MKLVLTLTYIYTAHRFSRIKQIGDEYFSEKVNIYIPILVKIVMS